MSSILGSDENSQLTDGVDRIEKQLSGGGRYADLLTRCQILQDHVEQNNAYLIQENRQVVRCNLSQATTLV